MKFPRPRRASPVITIVSLIDILTIVLIFFVVTMTFKTQQAQVQINLPEVKVAADKVSDNEPVILTVSQNGDIYLGRDKVALSEVGNAVKKLQEERKPQTLALALKADEKAEYGVVLSVLDALKQAGITSLPAFTKQKS